MKKGLKYTLVSLGSLVVLAGMGLGIMYVVSPYKVKRWLGIVSSYSDVFVDRLKGQPYTHGGYDGIDVSKHNGVIKWKEIAKNKRIKFVYIRATHGKGYVDRHYRRNIRLARKYGLKVGSYHLMSAGSSVTAQFRDFQKMVKKSEQDLIPVLDVEKKGIQGRWKGRQLQDSIQVFADLVKKHYASILSSIATRASIIRRWGRSSIVIISSSPIITPDNPLLTAEESVISGNIQKLDICMVLEKG